MNIGQKVRELRIAKNLTQEELADRSELSKGFISQLERDLTSPSIATLVDILQCLGTNLNEFFSDDEEEHVMPPMLETAGCPCLEPYIACLYQHTLTAMHIAFDTLFVTGHEWNTGKIPEYNVISIYGIYKEHPGTLTITGNKEQVVSCPWIPVGACLFDVFHHCVHFLYVFPDKPVHPVIPVVQADERFLAILVFCLDHGLFHFVVKHARLW